MRKHLPFFLILAGYFIVAGLFAVYVPAWQAPDEPAHYNVVRQVAERGCCPLIEPGDWDNPYLEQLKAADFAPDLLDSIPAIQYEDHQPPLYYMLLAPIYTVSGGSLITLRLASVVIGAGVVIAAYAVALRAFRGCYSVAWAAAVLVAFLPQHVHILASVNNDALALALCGAILWASIDHADGGKTPVWVLGLLVGAALLTKTTAYMMAGVAFVAVWMAPKIERIAVDLESTGQGASRLPRYATRYRTLYAVSQGMWHSLQNAWYVAPASRVSRLVLYLIPALALGALWWLRNISVYGFPDFLGLRAHDEVVVGQVRTAEYIAQFGVGPYISTGLGTAITSFYGQFGWMEIPLHSFAIGAVALAALIAMTIIGLLLAAISPMRRLAARSTWTLFGLTAFLAVAMLVYYNTSFVQFQGRYAYPLLIPLGITVVLGLDYLRERLPIVRNYAWVTAAVLSAIALLDLYLLWRVLLPGLTP